MHLRAVLEASWGHPRRLGGHLGRIGGIFEAISGRLGGFDSHLEPSWAICWGIGDLSGGWRDGPKRQGEFFWKKNQNHNLRSSARQAPLR